MVMPVASMDMVIDTSSRTLLKEQSDSAASFRSGQCRSNRCAVSSRRRRTSPDLSRYLYATDSDFVIKIRRAV